ncbi:MAG: DUF134 domain-containing protein [Anaerococcus sp.]
MARPVKLRKVCCLPENKRFGPLGVNAGDREQIIMDVDEYEAIRLIDLEGFSQEECALQMDVSRPTVQRIYTEARKKMAESLINGKTLIIDGGEYKLCNDSFGTCGRGCRKHKKRYRYMKDE